MGEQACVGGCIFVFALKVIKCIMRRHRKQQFSIKINKWDIDSLYEVKGHGIIPCVGVFVLVVNYIRECLKKAVTLRRSLSFINKIPVSIANR